MNRVLTLVAILTLVIGAAVTDSLAAQGKQGNGNNGNHGACCVDMNKDGKCDKFVDANNDGKCDNFIDANNDGKCDNCKGNCTGTCTGTCKGKNFTDANGDGINDNCKVENRKCMGSCKGKMSSDVNSSVMNGNCKGGGKSGCMGNCKGKNFSDANGDGKCDKFVDANNDGKCDNAAACCNNDNKGCKKNAGSCNGNGCKKVNTATTVNSDKVIVNEPYPNPFNASSSLKFQLKEAGMVNVSIYDNAGSLVKNLIDGQLGTGEHVAVFNPESIQAGQYYFVVKFNGNTISKQTVYFK